MIYYYCPANGDKYISLGLLCTRSFNFELTRLPLSDEKYEDKNIILLKPFFLIELWLDLSYNGALHNDFCKMCICTYTFFFLISLVVCSLSFLKCIFMFIFPK